MEKINWATVIASISFSTITAYAIASYLMNKFLFKLVAIDEVYRKKLIDEVIETVNKSLSKSSIQL